MSDYPKIDAGVMPAECTMWGIPRVAPPRVPAPAREVVNVEEPDDPPLHPVVPPYVIVTPP